MSSGSSSFPKPRCQGCGEEVEERNYFTIIHHTPIGTQDRYTFGGANCCISFFVRAAMENSVPPAGYTPEPGGTGTDSIN